MRHAAALGLSLLAAGGDPRREPELHGRAVTAVASDLDTPERRRALATELAAMENDVAALSGAREALRRLRDDPDLAWQTFALSLLAARPYDEPHGKQENP